MEPGGCQGRPHASLLRRVSGLFRLVVWIVVVGQAHLPWRRLGGIVPESVRYAERVVLASAAIVGCFLGACARDLARPGMGRSHVTLGRTFLLAPSALVAVALLWLAAEGADDWIGVLFAGLLAYWAGFDTGIGAWPQLCGRHYSLRGAIVCRTDDVRTVSPGRGDPFR